MGSLQFVESFVLKVFQEYLSMIINLFMFANPQATFAMLSFYYVHRPNYLQHIVFPLIGILQHYIEFDACTIAMLKKLLALGSFNTTMGHLTRR